MPVSRKWQVLAVVFSVWSGCAAGMCQYDIGQGSYRAMCTSFDMSEAVTLSMDGKSIMPGIYKGNDMVNQFFVNENNLVAYTLDGSPGTVHLYDMKTKTETTKELGCGEKCKLSLLRVNVRGELSYVNNGRVLVTGTDRYETHNMIESYVALPTVTYIKTSAQALMRQNGMTSKLSGNIRAFYDLGYNKLGKLVGDKLDVYHNGMHMTTVRNPLSETPSAVFANEHGGYVFNSRASTVLVNALGEPMSTHRQALVGLGTNAIFVWDEKTLAPARVAIEAEKSVSAPAAAAPKNGNVPGSGITVESRSPRLPRRGDVVAPPVVPVAPGTPTEHKKEFTKSQKLGWGLIISGSVMVLGAVGYWIYSAVKSRDGKSRVGGTAMTRLRQSMFGSDNLEQLKKDDNLTARQYMPVMITPPNLNHAF